MVTKFFGEPLIEGFDLVKTFGKKQVLKKVSFCISAGSFHALAGENGSGKTTLIKMLIGAYPPSSYQGVIKINPSAWPLSYTPENILFPTGMSVERYLFQIARLLTLDANSAWVKVDAALKANGIENLRKSFANNLSSGQKKKVMLAKVEVEEPKLIIMDEPATNLDFTTRSFLAEKLIQYNKKGATIIIISHLVKEIEPLINEITVLHYGEMRKNEAISTGTLSAAYEGAVATKAA